MTTADIPTISWIEQAVFSLPWSSSAFTYEVKYNQSSLYLVLRYRPWAIREKPKLPLPRCMREHLLGAPRLDSSILGYGGLWSVLDEAHICTLALREKWRGYGLGELLLSQLIEAAYEKQTKMVTLEARISNIAAQNLYAKYGFEIVGRRKAYYSDNQEDAFIMTTPDIATDAYQHLFRSLTDRLKNRLAQETTQWPPSGPCTDSEPQPQSVDHKP